MCWMEKQVQLFPGVTVPYSWFLWAMHGGNDVTTPLLKVPEEEKSVGSMERLFSPPIKYDGFKLKHEGVLPEGFELGLKVVYHPETPILFYEPYTKQVNN